MKAALREGIPSGRAARTSAIARDVAYPPEPPADIAGDTANPPGTATTGGNANPPGTAQPEPPATPPGPSEYRPWYPYGSLGRPKPGPAAGSPQAGDDTRGKDVEIISGGIHSGRPTATPERTAPDKAGPGSPGTDRGIPGKAPAGTRTGTAGLAFIALALGMLSHQVLDAMWLERVNWFWPFLGRFSPKSYDNFWLLKFWEEVRNPSEWVFALLVLVIVIAALFHWKSRGSSGR